MRQAYLLIFSRNSMEAVKVWANQSSIILTWRYDLPNTFYLISDNTAAEISQDYIVKFGKNGRHLVIEVSTNRQGLLPKETWYLLREKRHQLKSTQQQKLL